MKLILPTLFLSKSKNALLSIEEVFEHDTRRERETGKEKQAILNIF